MSIQSYFTVFCTYRDCLHSSHCTFCTVYINIWFVYNSIHGEPDQIDPLDWSHGSFRLLIWAHLTGGPGPPWGCSKCGKVQPPKTPHLCQTFPLDQSQSAALAVRMAGASRAGVLPPPPIKQPNLPRWPLLASEHLGGRAFALS